MRDDCQWFIVRNGTRQGPYTSVQLQQLKATGAVEANDLIWKEGLADWCPASNVPGLQTPDSRLLRRCRSELPKILIGFAGFVGLVVFLNVTGIKPSAWRSPQLQTTRPAQSVDLPPHPTFPSRSSVVPPNEPGSSREGWEGFINPKNKSSHDFWDDFINPRNEGTSGPQGGNR